MRVLTRGVGAVVAASVALITTAQADQCAELNVTVSVEKTLYVSPRNASEGMVVYPNCSKVEYVPTQLIASEFGDVPGPLTLLNCSETDIDVMVGYPPADVLYIDSTSIASYDFSNDARVLQLVMSWNNLDSLDDLEFPPNLRSLDLEGNSLQQVAEGKIPASVRTLILNENPFSTFDNISIPDSLERLYLYQSSLETIDFTLPINLAELYLDGSRIPKLENVQFPDSLQTFSCIKCKATIFRGVRLSPNLTRLNLDGNTFTEFEVRESDKSILLKLSDKSFDGIINQQTCAEPSATIVRFLDSFNVCVISDELFSAKYLSSSSQTDPSPPPKPSGSSNSMTILVVLAVLGSLLVLLCGALAYRYLLKRIPTEDSQIPKLTLTSGSTSSSVPQDGYLTNDVRNDEAIIPFRIAQDEVQLTRQIATGGYGVVYQGKFRGRDVAIKQLLRDKAREKGVIAVFMDEIRLCARLEHAKIVEFIGVAWSTLVDLAVVIEYMPGGDLRAALYSEERRPSADHWFHAAADLKDKCSLAQDVVEAVVYLHSLDTPIIHRDLKARNVLLSDSGDAKLSDFGVSRELVLDETMTGDIGTVAWIAPEVLRGERYTEKADIYSFGILMVELDVCTRPYSGVYHSPLNGVKRNVSPVRSNTHIALQVSTGALQPSLSSDCPDDVRELVAKCLRFDANERPSAVAIHYELQKIRHSPVAGGLFAMA